MTLTEAFAEIAAAIRDISGSTDLYEPSEMPEAIRGSKTVEVTIDNVDGNYVFYSDQNGRLNGLKNFISGTKILCLKGSFIIVLDTYATTSSTLENLTSTTGDVCTFTSPGFSTYDKMRVIEARQSGTIKCY